MVKIGLLIKKFATLNSKKVNVVGTKVISPKLYDLDIEEEAKYLDWDMAVFWAKVLIKTLGTWAKGIKV